MYDSVKNSLLATALFLLIFGKGFAAERIAFIDSPRVLAYTETSLGLMGDALLLEVNSRIKIFAEALNFDLIVQAVVYASPRMNATDAFLNYVDSKGRAPGNFSAPSPKVGFINAQKLIAAASTKGFRDDKSSIAHLNQLIAQVATSNKIDLVFQEAVWAGNSVDITDQILKIL